MNAVQSLVASFLNIKPIVIVREGHLVLDARYRSRQTAVNRIVEMTREAAGNAPVKIAVLHAQAPDEAAELIARVRQSVNCVESFVGDLTTSIAVHFGPGAIGTVVYPTN